MRLVFEVEPGVRLVFAPDALRALDQFRQITTREAESGGVLLGRYLLESPDIIVDEITTPLKLDKRSRFGFFRSKQHDAYVKRRWAETAGKINYIGLWHSHPEGDPSPSSVDLADWKNASNNDKYGGDRLFFLILGIGEIRVWSMRKAGIARELTQLRRDCAS